MEWILVIVIVMTTNILVFYVILSHVYLSNISYLMYFLLRTMNECNWLQVCVTVYHGENKVPVDELMMMSTLYKTNMLSWIFTVLAHWNNRQRIEMSLHSRHIILILSQPVLSMKITHHM
jgi:hypothetical protein